MGEPENSVVACSLSEAEQRIRLAELRKGFMQRVRSVHELPAGLAFRLDLTADTEREVREFVAFESQCCGFASFAQRRDESARALWLEITGPSGAREFFANLVPESLEIEPADGEDAG